MFSGCGCSFLAEDDCPFLIGDYCCLTPLTLLLSTYFSMPLSVLRGEPVGFLEGVVSDSRTSDGLLTVTVEGGALADDTSDKAS